MKRDGIKEILESRQAPGIMRDLQPFRSPVDRSIIGSRSDLREHNKRNGVVQVGTDYDSAVPRTPREDA